MQKKFKMVLSLFLILLFASTALAEMDFVWHHLITDDDFITRAGDVGDIDNDGDIDIVGYSWVSDSNPTTSILHWYENVNGNMIRHEITDNPRPGTDDNLKLVDLNRDGLLDINSRSGYALLYDGEGGFYECELPFGYNLIDYDNDDDLDAFAWTINMRIYDNEGVLGPWSLSHTIQMGGYPEGDFSLIKDVDMDGDIDFVGSEDIDIDEWVYAYYENDGNMNFTRYLFREMHDRPGMYKKNIGDIDSDGDYDILLFTNTSSSGDKLTWWEFNDTTFTEHILFEDDHASGQFVVPVDINLDGEMDIISNGEDENGIGLYINDGNENFAYESSTYSVTSLVLCCPVDFDNDGDLDIIVNDLFGFFFLENVTTSSAEEPDFPTEYEIVSIYPNPFNSSVNINLNLQQPSNLNVSIFNLIGQRVTTLANQQYSPGLHQMSWDATNYQSGTYIVRINSSSGDNQTRKIVYLK
jgi:Secretion system C-terminal sorting domain/FG-GAP-like repeat